MGFREAKKLVLAALRDGTFQHESWNSIDSKNLLKVGDVSAEQVMTTISRCNGTHHSCSPHHMDRSILVHLLKRDGWYIKFYIVNPDVIFISVHETGK